MDLYSSFRDNPNFRPKESVLCQLKRKTVIMIRNIKLFMERQNRRKTAPLEIKLIELQRKRELLKRGTVNRLIIRFRYRREVRLARRTRGS